MDGTHSGSLTVTAANLTISDDDTAGTVIALSVSPTSVEEDAEGDVDGNVEITVTATLQGTKTRNADTVVALTSTLGGTATKDTDYTHTSLPASITIGAEKASGSATFKVNPTDDSDSEGTETIIVSGSLSGFTVNTATLNLADDDLPVITLSLDVDLGTIDNQTEVGENVSSRQVRVTAARDTNVNASAVTVTLSVQASSTATSGADYTALTSLPTIFIPANTASRGVTFNLAPKQDVTVEGDETIVLGGTATGFNVTGTTLTLKDDDTASTGIALSVSPASLAESAASTAVTVTARLNAGAYATDTTVALALDEVNSTATKGTDYADPGTLATITIPAGRVSGTAKVNLNPTQDNLDEGTGETIRIEGTHAGVTPVLPVTSTDVTISDDDATPTHVDLSASPTSVREDDTSATTITVSAKLQGSSTRTTATVVNLNSTLGGTATAGTGKDYTHTALSASSITIPVGQSSGSATVTFNVTPLQDTDSEGTETILVSGTVPGNILTVNSAKVNLADDDLPVITLSLNPTSVGEDEETYIHELGYEVNTRQVRVTASRDTALTTDAVTVTLSVGASSTATGGVDYSVWNPDGLAPKTPLTNLPTISIPTNAASGSAMFEIELVQDRIAEGNETIVIDGLVGDGTTFSVDAATLTLTDDDAASAGITLSVYPASIGESANSTGVNVSAQVDAGAFTTDTTVTLALDEGNSTATKGTDYADPGTLPTITIPAGQTTGLAMIYIDPTQDNIDEGTGETIKVVGTHSRNLPVTAADITLVDDDTATTIVDLSASTGSIAENGSTTTITVSATLAAWSSDYAVWQPAQGLATRTTDTVVTLNGTLGGTATAGSGNDYTHTALSATSITIPAGQTSGSTTVTFNVTPIQDTTVEGTETIQVTGSATGFTVNPARINLTDDDRPSIASVALVSTPPYKLGDTVRARVTFNEAVDVNGSPVLQLRFATNYGRKDMTFDTTRSTTNTTTLEFTYTVRMPDLSTDGIAFYANQLRLPQGATIRRTGTTVDADLAYSKVDHNPSHTVDALAPPLTRIAAFRSEVVLYYHPNLVWSAPPEVLDTDSIPDASDFVVRVNGQQSGSGSLRSGADQRLCGEAHLGATFAVTVARHQ